MPDGEERVVNERAFDGVRVVELAQWVFVPVAGALLADWGADVIRIERPEGDPYRGLASQGIGTDSGGLNVSLALANRGKRSVALDLRREEGRGCGGAAPFVGRRLPDELPAGRPPAPGVRRRRRQGARIRDSCTHGATASVSGDPMPTRRATTRRRSGREAGWPTCSRHQTASTRLAKGARWVIATAPWRSPSASRPPSCDAVARVGVRWSTFRCSPLRCGPCRPTCSLRCKGTRRRARRVAGRR